MAKAYRLMIGVSTAACDASTPDLPGLGPPDPRRWDQNVIGSPRLPPPLPSPQPPVCRGKHLIRPNRPRFVVRERRPRTTAAISTHPGPLNDHGPI